MRTLFPLGVVALVVLALPGAVVFMADLLGYGPEINLWLERRFAVSHRVALSLPAALVMFAIPPLIILLYFLRLKRQAVAVPSTFLWKKSVEDLHVNRLMQWIRRNVLLLLQLLAILAMIYGVLGPRLHGAIGGGRYYILIIDNSASMSATDVAPNRLAWAKAEAIKEIDAATDSDFGMVIAFNNVAEIRQSYTANRAALRRAIEGIQTTNRTTKLDEAMDLAASLANPDRSTMNEAVRPSDPEPGKERTYVGIDGFLADVHLYSDGKFPPVPEFALANLSLNWHVPPTSADPNGTNNVAILEFNAERSPDDPTTILARAVLRNYSNKPVEVKPRVELLQNGNELVGVYDDDDTRRTKKWEPLLPNSERAEITYTISDVAENSDLILRLSLDGHKDAFPLDDQAWVVFGIIRKSRILVVGPENKHLRNFFDTASVKKLADVGYLPASVLQPGAEAKDYRTPARDGKYDLVIFDRCGPLSEDDLPSANTLFIGYPPMPFLPASATGDPVKKVKPVVGPSVRGWDSKHPVMRNLQSLDEVDISEAFQLPELPPRTQRLIEGSENLVLLAAIPRTPYTDLALTFPLFTTDGRWNTNWPLKVSFPLFMRNLLLAMGNVRDAGSEQPVQPGEVKHLRVGGAKELRLTKPDGALEVMNRGPRADFAVADSDQLGVYLARWDDVGGQGVQSRRFTVNLFDRLESDLSPVQEVSVGAQKIEAGKPRKAPQDLWKWPLVLGLFVLLLEWWVYNRRVQI